jgi:methylmalonyl-CoA mutase N-terminal domain/subunit
MMESLTNELVNSAMGIIEEIEAMGGMTKAIESGMAKLRIEEAATRKQVRHALFLASYTKLIDISFLTGPHRF